MTNVLGAGDPLDLQGLRLRRTELGQREISAKAMTLARPARNLLLIIDAKRSAGEWLGLVRGTTPEDLQQLLAAGLVAPVGAAAGAGARATPAAAAATAAAAVAAAAADLPAAAAPGLQITTARMSLSEALLGQSYRLLYDRLTAEARAQLGLIKGYKLILDIERCSGPDEIRQLAERFVEQVRALHGDTKARALAQRLADPP